VNRNDLRPNYRGSGVLSFRCYRRHEYACTLRALLFIRREYLELPERPSRLKWADATGTSMQRSAFSPASRRPIPRPFRYLEAGRFWVLALVVAAGLLVLALQWRAPAHAKVRAQISSEQPVAARPPQPEYGSGGASARSDAGRKSLGPLGPQAPSMPVTAANDETAMQKHQFALLGTTLTGDQRTALLRQIASGESRVVDEGGQVGGMTVAVVQADRVLLRSGGYTEELQLQEDSVAQAPLASPAPTLTSDVAADASRSERAPMASPTLDDVRALIEQGLPVPNPD
jgi:hypothetical protein